MRPLLVSAAIALAFTTSRLSFAVPTHALGDASTSSFSQGGTVAQTARGWEFQVNATNVQIVQLGANIWTDGTALTLSLWDDNSHTLLAQTSVTSSAHNWVFANLGSPVSLTSGGLYSVVGWANVTNTWYQLNNTPPAAFTPTGTIQYTQVLFDNGAGPNTFPTGTTSGQYGVTDIGYQIAPEPSTFVLILAALNGHALLILRRRLA